MPLKTPNYDDTAWPQYGGGHLPYEEVPSTPTGSWYALPKDAFELRGPNYLTDRVKQPSQSQVFETVSVTSIEANRPLYDIGRRLKPLRDFLASEPESEFFVTVRACPSDAGMTRNVIIVSRRVIPEGTDEAFDRAWKRFKDGGEDVRNKKLKYIAKLTEAPWLLLKTLDVLGGQRPVILGNGYLTQYHSSGANYVEVSVEIESSMVAKQIAGACIGYCASLTIQECFVVEGQADDELPERILSGCEFRHVDTESSSRLLREDDLLPFEDEIEDSTPPPPPPPKPAGLIPSSTSS